MLHVALCLTTLSTQQVFFMDKLLQTSWMNSKKMYNS